MRRECKLRCGPDYGAKFDIFLRVRVGYVERSLVNKGHNVPMVERSLISKGQQKKKNESCQIILAFNLTTIKFNGFFTIILF